MIKYKVGEFVAIHYTKSKCGIDDFFNYPEHGMYKKCEIIEIKRHWFYFFETMYLLSDGNWYQKKDLTPVYKIYFNVEIIDETVL